jgi:hypothetical protein
MAKFQGTCVAAVAAMLAIIACAPANAEQVHFNYRLPQVGDVAAQSAQYELDVKATLKQGAETVSNRSEKVSRQLDRQVNVLAAAGDRPMKVQVQYTKAKEVTGPSEQSGTARTMPIEGKAYLVERQGVALVVTDTAGQAVPDDQRRLVEANMDSVGHRNQLGRFLHGKAIEVGETVALPKEMAADLLGMREANGDAQKIELTLRGVKPTSAGQVADFAVVMQLKMGGAATLDVKGDLQIEPATCRLVSATFAGPISGKSGQADQGDQLVVLTAGSLKASVQTRALR